MDSFTHIALGAAVGGTVLGKKAGNRALFWGAIGGSIPDFDVVVARFYEPVEALFVHRGFSHSILFAIIAAPLLGLIISRIHKEVSFRSWTWLSFWAILSHSIIDCFNTYGTALLEPFSSARIAFDSIGIIDIFLIIPSIVLMLLALIQPKGATRRKLFSVVTLVYFFVFVSVSVFNKLSIERKAVKQIHSLGVQYSRIKTAPLPLTNFLWLLMAEDSLGYHYGYISNFDTEQISLSYVTRNSTLLDTLIDHERVRRLISFTEGYYTVKRNIDGSLWLHDLRFGSLAFFDEGQNYVFSFGLKTNNGAVEVLRTGPNRSFGYNTIVQYFRRIFG